MSELFVSIMEGLKEVGEMTGNAEAAATAQYYLENGVDDTDTIDEKADELITV